MNIATFLPLTAARGLEEVSFFTDQDLEVGGLYSLKIRNKTNQAILLSIDSALNQKNNLKSTDYALKKLSQQSDPKIKLPGNFIMAIDKLASFYAGNRGPVAKLLLTKIEMWQQIQVGSVKKRKFSISQSHPLHLWQFPPSGLQRHLKRLIRENQKPVVVVVSDENQSAMMLGILSDLKTLALKPQSKHTVWQQINDSEIIIVPRSLGPLFCLGDFEIIVINPGGESWRERRWPHFHWDKAIEAVAIELDRDLYLWSSLLPSNHYLTLKTQKSTKNQIFDINLESDQKAVQPNIYRRKTGQKNIIDVVFDRSVQNALQSWVSKQQKTLVYVTRRGLYPVLVCQDCRHTNYTKNFREQIQRYQIASNLQEWSDPNTTEEWLDRCEECGSWRLHPLAITLKQTEIALRELLGEDHNISVVDTVTDTPAQSRKTIKNFNNGDSTILLTTQRGLYLQTKPVPNSIIVSVDAALSSSSLNVETSIIRLLEHAKYLTTQNLFLQTRLEDNRVLNTFINQTYRKLQIQNLREREKMNFPPFSTQIKLTLPVDHNLPYEQNLKSLLKKLNSNLVILPGLDNYKVCLITVPRPIWHDDQSLPLKNYLFNLHNKYSIRINPDILL